MGFKIDFNEKKGAVMSSSDAFAEMLGINKADNTTDIVELDITSLKAFECHPFKLYDGEKLEMLIESIKENGVMTPITVRTKSDGIKEILAGHNRVNAARLAGFTKVPSYVKDNISDAQAKIIVTDSNFLQRSVDEMLPSELAKSLQMQLEACKEAKQKQGYINDVENGLDSSEINSFGQGVQLGHLEKSRDIVSKYNKMSNTNIQRYIRLNYLNESLLNMVDTGEIKLVPAVNISYLIENEQHILFSTLAGSEYKLDMKKAEALKERTGKLTESDIKSIISGEFFEKKKKPKLSTVTIKPKLISKFFNAYTTQSDIISTIELALEEYFERRRNETILSQENIDNENTGENLLVGCENNDEKVLRNN